MAEINILNSTYHGKLGRTTGVKWKNKEVIKGKIWSKTPENKAQQDSVRAFECLNRVSVAIAKKWWYWLGLKNTRMLKHNAVARLLKGCISNHTFTPSGFFPVFSKDGTNEITSLTYDNETHHLDLECSTNLSGTVGRDFSWLVLVFDREGKVYFAETPPAKSFTLNQYLPIAEGEEPFVLLVNSQKDGKKYKLGGLTLNYCVVSEVLYTELLKSSVWFYETEDKTAGTNYDTVTVDEQKEILYIIN